MGSANWSSSRRDTSYYGLDLYGQPRLSDLLARLEEVDRIEWIRLMYLYPQHLGDDLVDVIASSRKVLPYLDLPLQHINDEVLRRMRRHIDRRQTEPACRPAARADRGARAANDAHCRFSGRNPTAV